MEEVNLFANMVEHIDFMFKRLEDEKLLVSAQLSSAQRRIEYLERRFAELERPIRLYLKVKRMLTMGKD